MGAWPRFPFGHVCGKGIELLPHAYEYEILHGFRYQCFVNAKQMALRFISAFQAVTVSL